MWQAFTEIKLPFLLQENDEFSNGTPLIIHLLSYIVLPLANYLVRCPLFEQMSLNSGKDVRFGELLVQKKGSVSSLEENVPESLRD